VRFRAPPPVVVRSIASNAGLDAPDPGGRSKFGAPRP
jgi:hypothetical protein